MSIKSLIDIEFFCSESPKGVVNEDHFKSVLSCPFKQWNAIDNALAKSLPRWTCSQRSKMINVLIHFLEIKVIVGDYARHDQMLVPTGLVRLAWDALAIRKKLHKQVIIYIHDFHGLRRRQIFRPPKQPEGVFSQEYEENEIAVINRTQSLFALYFGELMPESLLELKEEDNDSILTDDLKFRQFQTPDLESAFWDKVLNNTCFVPANCLKGQNGNNSNQHKVEVNSVLTASLTDEEVSSDDSGVNSKKLIAAVKSSFTVAKNALKLASSKTKKKSSRKRKVSVTETQITKAGQTLAQSTTLRDAHRGWGSASS